MDSYIIQIQSQDELTVIIDKIIHTQAERVLLLIPEKSRIAQQALNFRLLKREADALGKEIIIVSGSPRVQTLALKASLQVHQETVELKRGAEKTSKDMTRRLADILAPSPTDVRKDADDAKKQPEEPREKYSFLRSGDANEKDREKTAVNVVVKKKEQEEPSNREKEIASFWAKRQILPSGKKAEFLPAKEKKKRTMPVLSSTLRDLVAQLVFLKRATSGLALPAIDWRRAVTMRILLLVFIGVSSITAGVTFYSILPTAKISITPFSENAVLELSVQGDVDISAVNVSDSIVPAQIFERTIESTKEITSTGEREIEDKAEGIITIYNAFSSASQVLVASTRFVAESGKLFRTTETITVPGAKVEGGAIVPNTTTVRVIASEPGAEYNIGPSNFSIPGFKGTPKYLGFYGKSESSMEGGRIGRVKVVTDTDYGTAREAIIGELEGRAEKEAGMSVPEGFIIAEDAVETSDVQISSTGNSGDAVDSFTMTGSIATKAFAVRARDVEQLLDDEFFKNFPGKRPAENGEEIILKTLSADFRAGTLELTVKLRQKAVAIIDEMEVAQAVRGKEERDVRAFLAAHPAVKEARVTFWPFWVHTVRDDVGKIEVVIAP